MNTPHRPRVSPGKNNKLVLNQFVVMRRRAVKDWLRNAITYNRLADGVPTRSLPAIQAVIECVLDREPVTGVVRGYGAPVPEEGPDLRCVYVELNLKDLTYKHYFNERDFK